MIYSVFKFGDTLVREVMVPRIDIVALSADATLQEALDTIIEAGHSRVPVYEDSIDNIRGILYAKDLLSHWRDKRTDFSLVQILREPYFVPETKKAGELLEELRARETHIAIVSDEYGGTAGLVTVEDLIEEIVGEIKDEYDFAEEAPYEMISETEYIFTAGFDLDDLNEMLDVSLPTDENDTLGGYIFTILGKVPQVGDKVYFNDTLEMEVLTLKGKRRIHKVRVRKIEEDEAVPESQSEMTDKHDS
jgi:CBS domain containing-hemolysin-like protein